MAELFHQRCFNHGQREAAARCPECRRFFCRECVTEHGDRVICATCLTKVSRTPLFRRRGFGLVLAVGQCVFGVFLAWFFFYLAGSLLTSAPASFHEGTLWQVPWFEP